MITISDCLVICVENTLAYNTYKKFGFNVVNPYLYNKRWHYRVRYISQCISLENSIVFKPFFRFNKHFLNVKPQKIILIGALLYEPILSELKRLYNDTPIFYLYPNIVDSDASIHPAILRKYNIIGVSWDKNDCTKYQLKYIRPAFDIDIIRGENTEKVYDACFIGKDKGRYDLVMKIKNVFLNAGYKPYIRISPDYSFMKFFKKDYSVPIPYSSYIDIVKASKCIIDIVQEGQIGTTMRTMEALFSGKKIISNNKYLKDYDFYHPANIFIIEDNLNDIPNFLNIPSVKIDEKILDNYKFSVWIKTLLTLD